MPAAFWKQWTEHLRAWFASRVGQAVLEPILEPILHPRWRLQALGLSMAIGHPLLYWVWRYWLPQPYERLWQRLAVTGLGACLLMPALTASPTSRMTALAISGICWLTLPVFFSWMYLCNGANAVWLASLGAMFLIYYHLSDWRIATFGTLTGLAAGWLLFRLFGPDLAPMSGTEWATHGVVLAFCWYMGLMLGLSSGNLRREQLKQVQGTMGIMAHELRAPLATMALIGDAVRNEAHAVPVRGGATLEQLANRLGALVRNINRQIDLQISNAQLMHLPPPRDLVSTARAVREAVAAFPYRNERERACVEVHVGTDFEFRTSAALFSQVIDNLMKNALRSLAAMPSAREPGDLRLEVDVVDGKGRICVIDRGGGMPDEVRARVFQLFVSTHRGIGHGLGLAFCRRVIQNAHGTIRVESAPGKGACFFIDLPIAPTLPVMPTMQEQTTS